VISTEKLKYLQTNEMKSKNMDNIQDRRVAKLKAVGHMYINMIFRFHKNIGNYDRWSFYTDGQHQIFRFICIVEKSPHLYNES
jgi:hypothetical protein